MDLGEYNNFDEVLAIIENAKSRALNAVNSELINMYWEVGKYLSELCSQSSFGDKIIDGVAAYISRVSPTIKGFNRRGLYRMRQFYETYKEDEFVSSMLTQISWTNHLLIMAKAKTKEERDFYIALVVKERLTSRELERQLNSTYYERYMLSKGNDTFKKLSNNIWNNILAR